jgi:hypothetical protein
VTSGYTVKLFEKVLFLNYEKSSQGPKALVSFPIVILFGILISIPKSSDFSGLIRACELQCESNSWKSSWHQNFLSIHIGIQIKKEDDYIAILKEFFPKMDIFPGECWLFQQNPDEKSSWMQLHIALLLTFLENVQEFLLEFWSEKKMVPL